MLKPRTAFLVVGVFLMATVSSPVSAQPASGTISGTVRVVNGEPVTGATVAVTNQQTGVAKVVTSGADGLYTASDLPAGLYTVSADVQGFRAQIVRNQRVEAGSTHTVNIALQVKFSEAVTVTAMKREETVFTTPVSVAAPTEQDLRDRGAQSIEDVAINVPNFSVQNLGPGQSTVAIRGISSGQIARDQPGVKEEVGSYLDESVISMSLFTPDMDLFDMNRVEVLRGPQGTLFGAGSLGGTVRYISNQPILGLSSVFGEVGGETVYTGGMGGDFKVGFNAPVSSKAALRVTSYYDRLPGWIDAVQPFGSQHPGEFGLKKDVNSGDRTGLRAALALVPIDNLTITPRFVYQKVGADGWNRVDEFNILANPYTTTRPAVTLGGEKQFTQIDEPYTDKFQLGDLDVKYDFGPAQLTSVTSFTSRDVLVVRDAGALTSSITGGSIGLPESVYTLNAPLNDRTTAHAWTQELRLSGGTDKDRLQWVVGGFYADSKRHYGQHLVVSGFEDLTSALGINIPTQGVYAPKDNLFWSDLNYDLKQYAFFGEGTFAITNKFSVTAGLRYYHFKEDKGQIFDGIFGSNSDGTPQIQPGTAKADGVAPRFIASYKVNDNLTFNAQAARGFRLGGVNDPLNVNLCTAQDLVTFSGRDTWKDETAWNYEIGAKSRFMGGKGSLNASVYYEDVKDLQVTVTAGSCSSRLIFNVPKSRSVGGELELSLAPTDHFDFSISGGYNDSQVRSTISGTEELVASTGIRSGNRLPSVPKFQAAVSATYTQPICPTYDGYLNGTYQHIGSRYTQLADQESGVGTVNIGSYGANSIGGPLTQNTFTFDPLMPAYDLVNLRLGIRHGIWDLAFYVNNLTNENAELALDRERGLLARVGFLTNQPRTFGVNTRVDF
ncbi:MAG TPA: TonB-dependent receptor [Thermoanaerobaculia bacterium]|nr:TonB-dependent receptor [Thermoanaerobaculia bacterium]